MNYEPRPPKTSESHPDQRIFRPDPEKPVAALCSQESAFTSDARLMRFDIDDYVKLTVSVSNYDACASIDLNPLELRMLAQMCVDAAHDLEMHPAAARRAKS